MPSCSLIPIQAPAQNFTYVYDRYGNRWYQNVTAGSGPAPSLNFTAATNQVTPGTCNPVVKTQYCFDAAGNMTADGFHTYTYDAEGNVTQVDTGSTGQYVYNALNERVRAQAFSTIREFVFNPAGQRVSMWNGSVPGQGVQGQYYWGSGPLAYYKPGAGAHYQHQDWLGTERMRTSYSGAVEDTYISLPFGDAQTTGTDNDPYHFATLDYDSEANVDHAQFREYSPTQGRWLEPDPYGGSRSFDNPQTLNRYAYVMNDPLSMTDPSGLEGGGGCGVLCDIGAALCLFFCGDLFGGGSPSFHGSLKPRPSLTGDPTWDGNFGESLGISTKLPRINLGVAAALGLPDAGCEFGACGPGVNSLMPGDSGASSNLSSFRLQFTQGLLLIWKTYGAMKNANVKGADRFYHCTAMQEATQLGPGGEFAAHVASWGREAGDTVKYQVRRLWGNGLTLTDSLADSKGDLQADYMGIAGADCRYYFGVRGLPQ